MTENLKTRFGGKPALALGGALLLLVGAGGGAGAMALTRPTVEMAPSAPTAIAKLTDARGIVTIKGQVEGVFGDRVLLRDATGHTLVDVGPHGGNALQAGAPLTAQGRFADGQLHARYLVAADGTVEEVAPPHHRHGPDGPPPPPPPHGAGAEAPPPPPPVDGPPTPAEGAGPASHS